VTFIDAKAQILGEDWTADDWVNFINSGEADELGIAGHVWPSVNDFINNTEPGVLLSLLDVSLDPSSYATADGAYTGYDPDGSATDRNIALGSNFLISLRDEDGDGTFDKVYYFGPEGIEIEQSISNSDPLAEDDDFLAWYQENYGTDVPEEISDEVLFDYYDYLLMDQDNNDTDTESQFELIINTLFKESVLTISQIKTCREAIEKITDIDKQKNYFTQLQYKVPYYNQRDNTSIQDEVGSCIPVGQRAADVMCNLTSEAGALSILGIENPNPNRQFEDNLEIIKREQKMSATINADKTISVYTQGDFMIDRKFQLLNDGYFHVVYEKFTEYTD